MVQLSDINPQHILLTFARLKFFYVKCPFTGDFYTILKKLCTHNDTYRPQRSADFKRYDLLKPKKNNLF